MNKTKLKSAQTCVMELVKFLRNQDTMKVYSDRPRLATFCGRKALKDRFLTDLAVEIQELGGKFENRSDIAMFFIAVPDKDGTMPPDDQEMVQFPALNRTFKVVKD